MSKDPKKKIRFRILLCVVTAVLTLLCMVSVLSAQEDGGSAADPAADSAVSQTADTGSQPASSTDIPASAATNTNLAAAQAAAQPATAATATDAAWTPSSGDSPSSDSAASEDAAQPVTQTDIPTAATPTDLAPTDLTPAAPAPNVSVPEASSAPAASAKPSLDQENQQVEQKTPPNESGAVPDVPPAWSESGQPYLKGNLGMAEQIRLLGSALDNRVNVVGQAFGITEHVDTLYDPDNMADIWAIYAVKSGMTDNYPYGVELQTEEQCEILQSIFWDMTNVTATVQTVNGERSGVIHVERKTYADVLDTYGLADQTAELAALTTPDMRAAVSSQLSGSILSSLTDQEFQNIEQELQGVSGERRAVVLAALSLEGKIQYFWGGKSYHVGWDDRWGEARVVTAAGSRETGTARPFGLDCSGFVSWVFINAGGNQNIINYIGNGTSMQWYNSKAISMSALRPGDLLFYQPPGGGGVDHVGIYIGGGKVVHCTTNSPGGVIVTGLGKFAYARTPYIYGEN